MSLPESCQRAQASFKGLGLASRGMKYHLFNEDNDRCTCKEFVENKIGSEVTQDDFETAAYIDELNSLTFIT